MKIVVTGPAQAFESDTGKPITDPSLLKKLNGLLYSKDRCSRYFESALQDIGVTGGQIRLEFDPKTKRLGVITEYVAPRKLTAKELKSIVDETRGQWSDGIGEGEFLYRKKLQMDVDLSSSGAGKIKIEQVEDGKKIKAPRVNQLIVAIRENKVQEAEQLLAAGAEVDGKDRDGSTPLHHACLGGHTDVAMALLKLGANVNAVNKEKVTPLAYLAMSNRAEPSAAAKVAKVMIRNGGVVDARDKEGVTPLMWAVNRGKLELVKCLIGAGADVNAKDRKKYNESTVIMYTQKLDVVKLLLRNGADPSVCNASGETAWEYSLHNTHIKGYQEVAELLRKHAEKKKKTTV